ncbi:S-layer homology domain-containing protein [Aureibacillus halotolerans]|uniref:Beta-N-acetylglucosaminidase n=1 Tax=Aureibacillus halotolerans TaxID=1508390 RepID=A0A4R6TU83_9BACI|nr:S-layer homology domain-containing protein [Aureibacillus halotolerans]TDQ36911.1 beta-N-acetylglucosaminidase [Aureibacillus halotolerans]
MKKTWLLAAGLVLAVPVHAGAANDDVSGHYFEVEIRDLEEAGIMNGYGNGQFKPDQNVTRAEFAAFVSRSLSLSKGEATFTDVSEEHPLYNEVGAAAEAGIVRGIGDDLFDPKRFITREEMAVMLDRAVQYKDIDPEAAELTFLDKDDILYPLNVRHTVALGIVAGGKDGMFRPKDSATRGQAATFIHRMLEAIAVAELPEPEEPITPPEEPVTPEEELPDPPETSSDAYRTATFDSEGQPQFSDEVNSWEEALELLGDKDADVLYKGDQIVWIADGLAVSKGLTYIYREEEDDVALGGQQVTYVAPGTEMKLLESGQERVHVMLQGLKGSVNASDIALLPTELIPGQSYYKERDGFLWHYIYVNNKYEAYLYGEAPSFFDEGEQIQSWDGATFEDETYRQYFSYMPLRSTTSYSAEELDEYVASQRPDSPLIGLGEFFKDAEETYDVNALYLLAHAIHESAWGFSQIAQEKNNLYGLRAYDVNPGENALAFPSVEANIDFAAKYISENYLTDAEGTYYNGGYLGNKNGGMNVVYASDPYWGQKIAGYMYRADKVMGEKDIHQLDMISQ